MQVKYYEALEDFDGIEAGDLSMKKGEVVTIISARLVESSTSSNLCSLPSDDVVSDRLGTVRQS